MDKSTVIHTYNRILNSNENEYTIAIHRVNIKDTYDAINMNFKKKLKVLCLGMHI